MKNKTADEYRERFNQVKTINQLVRESEYKKVNQSLAKFGEQWGYDDPFYVSSMKTTRLFHYPKCRLYESKEENDCEETCEGYDLQCTRYFPRNEREEV